MPYRSPSQRATTPQGRGRFPGFDVLDEVDRWDDVTAGVVLDRLALPSALAFFAPPEVAIAAPLLDLLLGQDADPRVPVLALIDRRLAIGESDGWHYDDLPEDAQAWRESLHDLDADARDAFGDGFAGLSSTCQAATVQAVGSAAQRSESWHGRAAKHVWSMWTRYACTAFYSHPWAWNEIGFPGPAYPRGYLNLGLDTREHWEMHEDAGRDDAMSFARRIEQAQDRHRALIDGSA